MPAAKALPIELSPDHERELKALVRARSTPQKLAERARIILLASDGRGVTETAEELGVWRKTAGHWRRRWLAAEAATGVAKRLSDAPRPAPRPISPPRRQPARSHQALRSAARARKTHARRTAAASRHATRGAGYCATGRGSQREAAHCHGGTFYSVADT
jgi:hypothetical protein